MAWPETVRKDDLRVEYYRGSGKGGQKKNKTSSACRITHLPTGHVASCEASRFQHKNREQAFRKLVDRLIPIMKAEAQYIDECQKAAKDVIRNYHEKRNEVVDKRTGLRYDLNRILNGDLDELHKDLMSQ